MEILTIFVLIGIAHGFFYATWGRQIFEYKADSGDDETYQRIAKNMKSAPYSWKIEIFLHRFIGVFFGWVIFWFLLDKRMNVFSNIATNQLGLQDIFLFLLGFIGINGRLPSVAHSVEKWFGFGKNHD
ncbi:MAG: hypothetical protein Q8Q49_05045 [bacterium]|nr:hypothetical protein [bacterium]